VKEYHKVDDVLFLFADQVVNFFLAKKELFKDVSWDNRIKIQWEHIDFFLSLQESKWRAAVCLNAEAIHINSIPDPEYTRYRYSAPVASPNSYFMQKNNLGTVVNQF